MFGILKGKNKLSKNVKITPAIAGEALILLNNGKNWVKGASTKGKPAYKDRPDSASFCLTAAVERAAGVLKYSTKKGGWYRDGSVDFAPLNSYVKENAVRNPIPATVKTIEQAIAYGRNGGCVPQSFERAEHFNDDTKTSFADVSNVLHGLAKAVK